MALITSICGATRYLSIKWLLSPRVVRPSDESSTARQWKAKPISLNGLLDYDEDDIAEKTMEVSLFAEAFHEMLQVRRRCSQCRPLGVATMPNTLPLLCLASSLLPPPRGTKCSWLGRWGTCHLF